MTARSRPLSETDRAAWADYVRTIKALKGRASPPPSAPAPTPVASPKADATPPRTPPPAARRGTPARTALVTGQHPAGLDKATWGRFSSGKVAAARTLDLHGKTAQAAHRALEAFLVAAHAEQVRCVEIITGRGAGEQGGVIRRELPHWLNLPSLRPLILAASHPHAHNPGSTRLLLKRAR